MKSCRHKKIIKLKLITSLRIRWKLIKMKVQMKKSASSMMPDRQYIILGLGLTGSGIVPWAEATVVSIPKTTRMATNLKYLARFMIVTPLAGTIRR